MRPKVLLFANTDWYLYNFRRPLSEAIEATGWQVVLVSPPGSYGPQLRDLGFEWIPFVFSPGGINPLREASAVVRLARLYRLLRPTLVHHFTIKCVIYGSLAARLIPHTAVVNAVTGAGYAFSRQDHRARLLRRPVEWAYRAALSRKQNRVVFQNSADLDMFLRSRLVDEGKVRLIRGSGVNCERFHPPVNEQERDGGRTRVLLATRLLRDKGVFEYAKAAGALQERYPNAEFLVAGSLYPDNPTSLTGAELDGIVKQGFVRYLGQVSDMPELLRSVDIVVLPTTYAEGTPRILIEAAASGRPVVATDIPGCQGLVENDRTGFLVPPGDQGALVGALEALLDDVSLRQRFGQAGREVVLRDFEESIVLRDTLNLYRELVPEFPVAPISEARSNSVGESPN